MHIGLTGQGSSSLKHGSSRRGQEHLKRKKGRKTPRGVDWEALPGTLCFIVLGGTTRARGTPAQGAPGGVAFQG